MRPRPHALPLLVAAMGLAACGDAGRQLGPSRSEARLRCDEVLSAVAARFGPTNRDPAFARLRPILAAYALVPSRIFGAP